MGKTTALRRSFDKLRMTAFFSKLLEAVDIQYDFLRFHG
jgi:hypothetical protein